MKFLYSDTRDYVDPDYDFLTDRHAPARRPYWDDKYAHEIMHPPPYDGLMVAMSAVKPAPGVASSKVRYSTAEQGRMLRDGIRKFLRLDGAEYKNAMVMGDCGSFAYVQHQSPAYSPEEVFEFYTGAGFSHGVSPDHIIFACDTDNPPCDAMDVDVGFRHDLTLHNAYEFMRICRSEDFPFEPLGAVQGWSPQSIGQAAQQLEQMGYRYLAIGGLVPLKADVIHQILRTLRATIKPETNIHLVGFAKADAIRNFTDYGITSFDTSSPLIRAFMDEKANYYAPQPDGSMEYYAAIRIPQSTENFRLMQGIKRGMYNIEELQYREARALTSLRKFDKSQETLATTVDAIMDYHRFWTADSESADLEQKLTKTRFQVERTLEAVPWKKCGCAVCTAIGVEVIIFRSANRNRRRGFHNLGVYHQHLQRILKKNQ
jgi:hypothetical protein